MLPLVKVSPRERKPLAYRSRFPQVHVFARLLSAAFLVVSLAAGFAAPQSVQAQDARRADLVAKAAPDLARVVQGGATAQTWPVIVTTDGSPIPPAFTRFGAQPQVPAARPAWLPLGGATYATTLSAEQLTALAADSRIRHISPDRRIRAFADYAPQSVGADLAWRSPGVTGRGITVAVLDTGVAPHPDLSPNMRLVGWADLIHGRPTPYDDNGHGTHVAGIVAGNGLMAHRQGYRVSLTRLAPETRIVGVKVLDANGGGSVSTVMAGIEWVIANRRRYSIRVLNLSMGHPVAESYKTDPLCQAVERAWKAGIVVVVAAGNRGRSVPDDPASAPEYGSIASPGNDPYVITVGAMNTVGTAVRPDDRIASYSSRGPAAIDFVLKPDLVAPGNQIESLAAPNSLLTALYPGGLVDPAEYQGRGSSVYYRLSGTSMAAPVVAGAAALLLQAAPTLSPDTVKARLMLSATRWATPDGRPDPCTYGAGYLNVPAALADHSIASAPALSPPMAPAGSGLYAIPHSWWTSGVWSENITWGGTKRASWRIWGASEWDADGVWNSGFWEGAVTASEWSEAEAASILLNGE